MFNIKLALKYFLRKPVSWLATLAVAISVFVVLVVMTIMHGLVIDYVNKTHATVGDVIVYSDSLVGFPYYDKLLDEIRGQDFVEAATPVIKSFAMLSVDGGSRGAGVDLIGVEANTYDLVTEFRSSLYRKMDNDKIFAPYFDPQKSGCIRGILIMNSKNAQGKFTHNTLIFEKLILTCFPLSYKGTLLKAASGIVDSKSYYVANDSDTGLANVDSSTIYIPFSDAQMLCGMDSTIKRVSALYVKIKHGKSLESCVRNMNQLVQHMKKENENGKFSILLKNVRVEDWKTYKRESIAPMEKEQGMLTALFLLIALVTVFVIFVVFFMIVHHKLRDIGVLKSFGISVFQINSLFLLFATMIGVVGTAIGSIGGWLFLTYINTLEGWLFKEFGWQLWNRSIYDIGEIPHNIQREVFYAIIICSLGASLLGAFFPVFKMARRDPVKLLSVDE